jgi:uncharacterized membrane protein
MRAFIITGIIMLLLDSIYLQVFNGFFNSVVRDVQGTPIKFKIMGAILCYLFLIGGLNYFIISKRKPLLDAFILGIVIYGVYETTTYALFDKWSPKAVILDTLWGGILFTLTTYFTYKLIL